LEEEKETGQKSNRNAGGGFGGYKVQAL